LLILIYGYCKGKNVHQIGNVVISKNVVIGDNSTLTTGNSGSPGGPGGPGGFIIPGTPGNPGGAGIPGGPEGFINPLFPFYSNYFIISSLILIKF
jgi:hypothetical protein